MIEEFLINISHIYQAVSFICEQLTDSELGSIFLGVYFCNPEIKSISGYEKVSVLFCGFSSHKNEMDDMTRRAFLLYCTKRLELAGATKTRLRTD